MKIKVALLFTVSIIFFISACTSDEEKIKTNIDEGRLDEAIKFTEETSGEELTERITFLADNLYDSKWYGLASIYYNKIKDTVKEKMCYGNIVNTIAALPEGNEYKNNLPVENSICISNDLIFLSNSENYLLRTSFLPSQKIFEIPLNNMFKNIVSTNKRGYCLGSVSDTIWLFNVYAQRREKIFIGHASDVTDIRYLKRRSSFISASWDKTVMLWNIKSSAPEKIFKGHNACITSLATSNDENIFASGSWDRTIKIWNIANGKCLRTISSDEPIIDIAFSPGGDYLYSISKNSTIVKWKVSTGEGIEALRDHSALIKTIEISEDGDYLLSGDYKGIVKIFDVRTSKVIRTIKAHETAVISMSIAPNSLFFITAGLDHKIKFWCLHERKGRAKSL